MKCNSHYRDCLSSFTKRESVSSLFPLCRAWLSAGLLFSALMQIAGWRRRVPTWGPFQGTVLASDVCYSDILYILDSSFWKIRFLNWFFLHSQPLYMWNNSLLQNVQTNSLDLENFSLWKMMVSFFEVILPLFRKSYSKLNFRLESSFSHLAEQIKQTKAEILHIQLHEFPAGITQWWAYKFK